MIYKVSIKQSGLWSTCVEHLKETFLQTPLLLFLQHLRLLFSPLLLLPSTPFLYLLRAASILAL